jgi:hypothetical protein
MAWPISAPALPPIITPFTPDPPAIEYVLALRMTVTAATKADKIFISSSGLIVEKHCCCFFCYISSNSPLEVDIRRYHPCSD